MASINEVRTSRNVTIDNGKPSSVREYYIVGVDSEQAALDALLPHSLCPKEFDLTWKDNDNKTQKYTLARQKVEIREESTYGESGKDHVWHGKATYGVSESSGGGIGDIEWSEPPTIRWQMDFTTETVNMKVAISQTQYGNDAPDCGNFINVVCRDGMNQPEGVSVLAPSGILRGSKTYTASDWNTILSNAKDKIGKTNASAFSAGNMTFGAGELLFVGATVRETSSGHIEGEFQFLYSPSSAGNVDGISYRKGGWEYLWVYSIPKLDGRFKTEKTGAVFVSTVYESTSFSGLFE